MFKNLAVLFIAFPLALLVLIISIFKVAGINYVLSESPKPPFSPMPQPLAINYILPHPGSVLPDSPIWPLKALRDKILLTITTDPLKKATLELALADKRLVEARILFEKNKSNLAISTLTKAEKYLESADIDERTAHRAGADTKKFLAQYVLAALMHRQAMNEMLSLTSEDVRPIVIKAEEYSKVAYENARDGLMEATVMPPQNPFQ